MQKFRHAKQGGKAGGPDKNPASQPERGGAVPTIKITARQPEKKKHRGGAAKFPERNPKQKIPARQQGEKSAWEKLSGQPNRDRGAGLSENFRHQNEGENVT